MAKEKDTKKKAAPNQKQVSGQKKERVSLKEYFKGVRLEMKKVVWPTRKELGSYTAVVLAACAAFALIFWAIDSAFLLGLRELLGITLTQ